MTLRILTTGLALAIFAMPAFADEIDELRKEGDKLLEALPDIPADLDDHYFYELDSGDNGLGWMEYKFDSVEKGGQRYYRYRARFAWDIKRLGWFEGESTIYLNKDFTPARIKDDYLRITPFTGKGQIESRIVFTGGELESEIFSRGNREEQTISLPSGKVIVFVEPLFDRLDLKADQKFVLINYDHYSQNFQTYEYEVTKRPKGEYKITSKLRLEYKDPEKKDEAQQQQNQEEQDPDKDESIKVEDGYIIVDGKGAIKTRFVAEQETTYKRVGKDRIIEIRKKLDEMLQENDKK